MTAKLMFLYIVVNRAGPSLKDEELYWLLNEDPSFNNLPDNENDDTVDQRILSHEQQKDGHW